MKKRGLDFYVRLSQVRSFFMDSVSVVIEGVSPSEPVYAIEEDLVRTKQLNYLKTFGITEINDASKRIVIHLRNMGRGGMCNTEVPFSELAILLDGRFVPFASVRDKIIFS